MDKIKKSDILIIGGGPAGMVSALTAKKYYPHKTAILISNVEQSVVPCGIPYMFSSLVDPEDNKAGFAPLKNNEVELLLDDVTSIDRQQKVVFTEKGENIKYQKLIIATGSQPIQLPIKGIDKNGIFCVRKDMDYLKKIKQYLKDAKDVVVLGGGFIGVEFADELSKIPQVNVTLVELLPRLLRNSFDSEFSQAAREKLDSQGVRIMTGVKAEEFLGQGKVEQVLLSTGETIKADTVILGVGSLPDSELAQAAGLSIDKNRGIWVDEYMRTTDSDIFAVGDCAAKKDFYTRRNTAVMLASTATAEARIAGANLFKLKVIRENKGTIAAYSTYIDGLVLGSAGITEETAKSQGFEIVSGSFSGIDKHPASMPGAKNIKAKLIFSRQSGIILGGQVLGGASCGELINLISLAIQKRMSVTEFETLQLATHPYLTPPPTKYPLIVISQQISSKLQSI